MKRNLKILVAAGGTGGHLFPALAVVQEIEDMRPGVEFQFTGREDKIEGELMPKMGYDFFPINVRGLGRLFSTATIKLPFQIYRAFSKLKNILKSQNFDAVLCAGAYISFAPALAAKKMGLPLFLMEANVNPGKSINLLSKRADLIFTSFEESSSYFADEIRHKLIVTGNPVRREIRNMPERKDAAEKFGIDPGKKTILIFGGSLGARSINSATEKLVKELKGKDIQIIWQTGKLYEGTPDTGNNVRMHTFIDDMASAYAAADLIVARSGATTVAELAAAGKPAILVPFPSASNNEQKFNAKILEERDAGIMITDDQISEKMVPEVKKLMNNEKRLAEMSKNAKELGKPDAAEKAAEKILEYLEK